MRNSSISFGPLYTAVSFRLLFLPTFSYNFPSKNHNCGKPGWKGIIYDQGPEGNLIFGAVTTVTKKNIFRNLTPCFLVEAILKKVAPFATVATVNFCQTV